VLLMQTRPDAPEQVRLAQEWGWMAARTWEAQAALARDSLERVIALSQSAQASVPSMDRDALAAVSAGYADFVNRAVSLSLNYADDMAALVQTTATRLLQDVQAGPGRSASNGPSIHVLLNGSVGTSIVTRVTLANHQPREHDVTFEVGPVTGPRGSFAPSLRVRPAVLTLAPGAEADVELTLDLPAEDYEPAGTYAGIVTVRGGDEAVLALTIQVDPAEPAG
jgi:hypothetical protein